MTNIERTVFRMVQNAVSIGTTQILSFKEINPNTFEQLLLSTPTYDCSKTIFCDLTCIAEHDLFNIIRKLSSLIAPGSSLVFRTHCHCYSEIEQELSQYDLLIYEYIFKFDLCLAVKRSF